MLSRIQGTRKGTGISIALSALMAISFLVLTALSIAQFLGYNQHAMDLARMSQAIWSVSHGRPLVWTGDGIDWSRLANHVEIAYLPLSLVYALWPSPVSLLIIQAALFVSGAVPVFTLSRRHLDDRAALLLSAIYLLYPAAQTAVLFEFHGDTLAAPLLLWAIDAADRRSWRWFGLWIGLALSCKMYVAAPVAVLGFVLWRRGERRAGAVTTGAALLWGAFAFLVIRSLFAPETSEATATPGAYLAFYFLSGDLLASLPLRVITAIIVFGPLLLLMWRAPFWLLPGITVLIPALLSTGPGPSYDYRYHHYILGVPFLLAAAIYGAWEMRRREGDSGPWRRRIWLTFAVTLLFNALLVDTPLNPRFFISDDVSGVGLTPSQYRRTSRDALKDEWLQTIPDEASLMASDSLAVHLINRPLFRRTNMMFSTFPDELPLMDYVVVDGLYDYVVAAGDILYEGGVASEHDAIAALLHDDSFVLERARDGLLQFGRHGPGLMQQVERHTEETGMPIATFDQAIGLVGFEAEPAGPRHFRLQFTWVALQPLDQWPPLIAVSQSADLHDARILHLPTLGLLPTTAWQEGELIVERFEVELPEDVPPGDYLLAVSWYDTSNPYAPFTDERSRVGQPVVVGSLTVRTR